MTAIQKVRREYQEPFRDVVSSYASLGYSIKATARILEISPYWFDVLCQRHHLKSKFDRRKYNDSCKPPGRPRGIKDNRAPRYTDEQLLTILGKYPLHISGHQYDNKQRLPCSDTIIKRFGSWRKAKKMAHERRGEDGSAKTV